MSDRVYAIHTDGECERLDAQALLAGVSEHVRHVPAQPSMRILDAGCGSGSMARESGFGIGRRRHRPSR